MAEAKVLALKCPGCGAALQVRPSIDAFACSYCASSLQVNRGEGVVSLRLLTDAMQGIQRGTDRTAAELAIKRLSEELRVLEREAEELRRSRPVLAAPYALPNQAATTKAVVGATPKIQGKAAMVIFAAIAVVLGIVSSGLPMGLALAAGALSLIIAAAVVYVLSARAVNPTGNDETSIAQAKRDAERRSLEQKEAEVASQIARVQTLLQKNRQIVDS